VAAKASSGGGSRCLSLRGIESYLLIFPKHKLVIPGVQLRSGSGREWLLDAPCLSQFLDCVREIGEERLERG
jgi:hypothetical protein